MKKLIAFFALVLVSTSAQAFNIYSCTTLGGKSLKVIPRQMSAPHDSKKITVVALEINGISATDQLQKFNYSETSIVLSLKNGTIFNLGVENSTQSSTLGSFEPIQCAISNSNEF